MRKLASIQRITNILPIEGYDRVELAIVLGWQCIISKSDNLKIGDLIVFFEPDSVLPEKPEFEFMRQRKFRVRTIKMCKQLSQGLIMPLNIIPMVYKTSDKSSTIVESWQEGDNITDLLGVVKYDPEAIQEEIDTRIEKEKSWWITKKLMRFKWFRELRKLTHKKSDDFPSFLHKTDEERIQSCPSILKNNLCTVLIGTEKLDGTSTSFAYTNQENPWWFPKRKFYVCSRNKTIRKPDKNNKYWQTAIKYDIEHKLKDYNGNICIQGEQCGPGIQKNKYNLSEVKFFVFDIWDLDNGHRFRQEEMEYMCKKWGLDYVPTVARVRITPEMTSEDFVKLADNLTSTLAKIPAEGIVFRSRFWDTQHISFKALSREFEIKFGK